jgi:trehalose 6-phosphate phosphatase
MSSRQKVNSTQAAMLMDYDGTLTPIVVDPSRAYLPAEGLKTLKQLLSTPNIICAIVSGRRVETLQHFLKELAGAPLLLCGLHGGEIFDLQTGQYLLSPSPSYIQEVSQFKQAVLANLMPYRVDHKLRIEDKTYSLAVHYREAAPWVKELTIETLQKCHAPFYEHFRLQPGKEVLEFLPIGFNKGNCVHYLYNYWRLQGMPETVKLYYAGDDLTDEYGFKAINQLEGTSILVSPYLIETQATVQVKSLKDLYRSLINISTHLC